MNRFEKFRKIFFLPKIQLFWVPWLIYCGFPFITEFINVGWKCWYKKHFQRLLFTDYVSQGSANWRFGADRWTLHKNWIQPIWSHCADPDVSIIILRIDWKIPMLITLFQNRSPQFFFVLSVFVITENLIFEDFLNPQQGGSSLPK